MKPSNAPPSHGDTEDGRNGIYLPRSTAIDSICRNSQSSSESALAPVNSSLCNLRKSAGSSTSYQEGSIANGMPAAVNRFIVCGQTLGVLQSISLNIGGT